MSDTGTKNLAQETVYGDVRKVDVFEATHPEKSLCFKESPTVDQYTLAVRQQK